MLRLLCASSMQAVMLRRMLNSRSISVAQVPMQPQMSVQAMLCLLMANLKAADNRPFVTLTDLQDYYLLYWIDGSVIYYWKAPSADLGWAVTCTLLKEQCGAEGPTTSMGSTQPTLAPLSLQPIVQRKKMEVKAGIG